VLFRLRTHKLLPESGSVVIRGLGRETIDGSRLWLSDEQFARLRPHLRSDTRGKPRADDRRVTSGIIHVLKCGCRWVDAPSAYGPRKMLYNRFVR
jgi:transposase